MTEPSDDRVGEETAESGDTAASGDVMTSEADAEPEDQAAGTDPETAEAGSEPEDLEALRERVEAEYDFDDFGAAEMERMSVEEWEAAFDPDTWITGDELLDRLEADLKTRVVERDVFARVERLPDPDRLVAYSDEGYAVVYPDGSIEGRGTVLRDVKPSVALASMDDYEVPDDPEGELLPDPMEVPEESGEFGNLMLQIVAGAQVLAGIGLLASPLVADFGRATIIAVIAGLGFLCIGLLLFFTVANARLSDRFRAEEYRNRLRAVGVDSGERPEFLPEHVRDDPRHDDDQEPGGESADGGDDRAAET
jgi:hypothetical protein